MNRGEASNMSRRTNVGHLSASVKPSERYIFRRIITAFDLLFFDLG